MSSATTTCVTQVSPSEQPSLGIGLILGVFEREQPKTRTATGANSLRRTLSAVDMSSPIVFSSSDEIHIDQEDVEQKNDLSKQKEQFDIWSSIPIQKPSSLPPPYIHPLVKKSKSCLSLKSLEICTENLGCESGSDGYPPSVIGLSDTEEEHEEIEEVVVVVKVDVKEVVLNYSKKSSSSVIPRTFPPPLNSLSRPGGGTQMNTHRKDGRLVIEAVFIPASQNCFSAQRQDGRLVLTFAAPISESKSELFDNEDDVFETDEEVEFGYSPGNEIEEPIMDEEENKGIVLEMTSTTKVPKLQPAGVMNVYRSALMVNKFTGLTNNRNPTTTWSLSSLNCGIYHSLNQQSLPNTKNTCYNNNRSILLISKNNYYDSNNLIVKDSTTTKGGEKDYKEEKQNSNGEKLVVDLHLTVPAYCKPELRRPLILAPFCIATS